jgi:hypothetical protein
MDELVNDNEEENTDAVFEPLSEGAIQFRGTELRTATLADQQGYVSLNSVCDAFGLFARSQRRRLYRSSYWLQYAATIMMDTPKGKRPTVCISAIALPLFLTGVEVERVQNPESRQLIEAFLDEAMDVLAEHFEISEKSEMKFLRGTVARLISEREETESASKKVQTELADFRKSHDEKIEEIRQAFSNLRQQVRVVEAYAGPKARLTPEQMGQLRILVDDLASALTRSGILKPYPGIYADILRITGVSKSEDMQQVQFQQVIAHLQRRLKDVLAAEKEDEEEE